jgi:hypothetical protein
MYATYVSENIHCSMSGSLSETHVIALRVRVREPRIMSNSHQDARSNVGGFSEP